MSTAVSKSMAARVVKWAACLLGTAVVLMFVVFAIGEGPPPWAAMNASFAAVGVMLVGYLVLWWKDWLGGVIGLAGLGWFQAIEIAANGQPAGGIFALLIIPGVLGLLAGIMRRLT
jgi:hypothetical protein